MQLLRRKYMVLITIAMVVSAIVVTLIAQLVVGTDLRVSGWAGFAAMMVVSFIGFWRLLKFLRLLQAHNCRLCPICEYPLPTERRLIWSCSECGSDVLAEELERYWEQHVSTFKHVDPPLAK